MFKIEALDHVALAVRDVERSAQWYADVLGFKQEHEGMWDGVPIFVGNGAAAIALFPAAIKQDRRPTIMPPCEHFILLFAPIAKISCVHRMS